MIEKSALDFEGILGRRDKIYFEEGIKKSNLEVAKNLIKEGLDDETIKRISKLDQKEIDEIKQNAQKNRS